MAVVIKDRVKVTSTTTGTGTFTLGSAVAGFQDFSVVGDGNQTYYAITDNTDWEVGVGTYSSTGPTLSRDTILESSNSNNAVNFGAGSKYVFLTLPAEKAITTDNLPSSPAQASGSIIVNNTTVSENYTIASGTNGFSVGPITVSSGYAVTVASGQRWVVI